MFYKTGIMVLAIMYILHKRKSYRKGFETSKERAIYTVYVVLGALNLITNISLSSI